MDAPRPHRNRIHFDVSVSQDQAEARIKATLAAGGTLVSDEAAPSRRRAAGGTGGWSSGRSGCLSGRAAVTGMGMPVRSDDPSKSSGTLYRVCTYATNTPPAGSAHPGDPPAPATAPGSACSTNSTWGIQLLDRKTYRRLMVRPVMKNGVG